MTDHNILTLGNPAGDFDRQLDDIRGGAYDGVVTDFLLEGTYCSTPNGYESVLEDIARVAGEETSQILRNGQGDIDAHFSERVQKITSAAHDHIKSVSGNVWKAPSRRRYAQVSRIQHVGARKERLALYDLHAGAKGTHRYAYGVLVAEAAKEAKVPFVMVRTTPSNEFSVEHFIDYDAALNVLTDRRAMSARDMQYIVADENSRNRERHAANAIRSKVKRYVENGWGKWKS